MEKYIYRYISFANFVDVVQTETLNFVLPNIWEDVKENSYVKSWIEKQDKDIGKLIAEILMRRTYAQSWTSLAESDAMWRIYNYNNQSLRIKVSQEAVTKLGGVYIQPVIYSDEYIDYTNDKSTKREIFIKLIAQKRIAFSHEKEVRLIYVDTIDETDLIEGLQNLFTASNILKGKPTNIEAEGIEALVKELICINIFCTKTSHSVSFSHVKGFISGVLVNPLAPEWYVNTVKQYCELNSIPFEGKSKLYEGEKDE